MIYRNGQPFNTGSSFEANGVNYPPNWYFYATQEEKNQLGFTVEPDPVFAITDPRFYYVNNNGVVTEKAFEVCQNDYRDNLAAIRWNYETAGIIYNELLYVTDPVSKVNYLGAMQRAIADPQYTVLWKARTTVEPSSAVFVSLSANDMIAIANYAITYITACFENENNLLQQINTVTTIQELSTIDLESDWPSQYYS